MGIKIYIDDIRACPTGWIPAHNYNAAIILLNIHRGNIDNVCFDHDLGCCYLCMDLTTEERVCPNSCPCMCHKTGYDIVTWMEENDVWPKYRPTIHSANPVGATRIAQVINRKYNSDIEP